MENDVMSDLMRLDRFLVLTGAAKSRSDAKKILKNGLVQIGDRIEKNAEAHVNPDSDRVLFRGREITYRQYRYFLLHKPQDVISATKDRISDTVLQLIPEADPEKYFPVGRLDKDTEGLLLITNDGDFAHRLTSPRKKVYKTYFARITGNPTEEEIRKLESGITLSDFTTAPARFRFLKSDGDKSECLLSISEGRFHQVKRMYQAIGHTVLYLKRIAIGGLTLPEDLKPGEYKEYTREQLDEAINGSDPQTV